MVMPIINPLNIHSPLIKLIIIHYYSIHLEDFLMAIIVQAHYYYCHYLVINFVSVVLIDLNFLH